MKEKRKTINEGYSKLLADKKKRVSKCFCDFGGITKKFKIRNLIPSTLRFNENLAVDCDAENAAFYSTSFYVKHVPMIHAKTLRFEFG